jgi:hypothetical protein
MSQEVVVSFAPVDTLGGGVIINSLRSQESSSCDFPVSLSRALTKVSFIVIGGTAQTPPSVEAFVEEHLRRRGDAWRMPEFDWQSVSASMPGLLVVLSQAQPPTLEVTAIPPAVRESASVGFNS